MSKGSSSCLGKHSMEHMQRSLPLPRSMITFIWFKELAELDGIPSSTFDESPLRAMSKLLSLSSLSFPYT